MAHRRVSRNSLARPAARSTGGAWRLRLAGFLSQVRHETRHGPGGAWGIEFPAWPGSHATARFLSQVRHETRHGPGGALGIECSAWPGAQRNGAFSVAGATRNRRGAGEGLCGRHGTSLMAPRCTLSAYLSTSVHVPSAAKFNGAKCASPGRSCPPDDASARQQDAAKQQPNSELLISRNLDEPENYVARALRPANFLGSLGGQECPPHKSPHK